MDLIKKIWVITEDGLTIFSRYYDKERVEESNNGSNDLLISGYLSAVNSLSLEITKGKLQGIITDSSQLLVYESDTSSKISQAATDAPLKYKVIAETHYDAKKEPILKSLAYIHTCIFRNLDIFLEDGIIVSPEGKSEKYIDMIHEVDSYLTLKGFVRSKNRFTVIDNESILDNIVGVTCATLANNKKYLITGGGDTLLKIWEGNSLIKFLTGSKNSILGIAPSQHTDTILSITEGGYYHKWDIEKEKIVFTQMIENDEIKMAQFYEKKNKIVVLSKNNTIRAWDLIKNKQIYYIDDLEEDINYILPVWDESSGLAYFTSDGEFYIYNIHENEKTVLRQNIPTNRMVAAQNGDWLVYPNQTELILASQYTFEVLKYLQIDGGIKYIQFIGRKALIVSKMNGDILIFAEIDKASSNLPPAILRCHQNPAFVLYNDKDLLLYTLGTSGAIKIWENLDYDTILSALKNAIEKSKHRFKTLEGISRWLRRTRKEIKNLTEDLTDSILQKYTHQLDYYQAQIYRIDFSDDFKYPWWIKDTLQDTLTQGNELRSTINQELDYMKNELDKLHEDLQESG